MTNHFNLMTRYYKERRNAEIISDDYGFIVYMILNDSCLIDDIFVVENERKKHIASRLADKVKAIAIHNECEKMVCVVNTTTKGCTEAIIAILKYGFRLADAYESKIILTYNLESEV